MRVIVTGPDGFVASHIVRALKNAGHEVLGFWRDYEPSFKGVDAVVHAAAAAGPWYPPEQIITDNVKLTQAVAEQCKRYAVPKVVYLSSTSVYGTPLEAVVDEDTPIRDGSLYGASKYLGERIFAEMGVPTVALRLPGVIGPGAHEQNWLVSVARKIVNGEPVPVFNAGKLFNHTVHVDDVAAFVLHRLVGAINGFSKVVLCASDPIPLLEAISYLGGFSAMAVDLSPAPNPFILLSKLDGLRGFCPMSVRDTISQFKEEYRRETLGVQSSLERKEQVASVLRAAC